MADATAAIEGFLQAQWQAYADFMEKVNDDIIEKNVNQQGMGKI